MTQTPLPLSREIARVSRDIRYEGDDANLAIAVDARIRPLVEALLAITEYAEVREEYIDGSEGGNRTIEQLRAAGEMDESITAARAALKAAGARMAVVTTKHDPADWKPRPDFWHLRVSCGRDGVWVASCNEWMSRFVYSGKSAVDAVRSLMKDTTRPARLAMEVEQAFGYVHQEATWDGESVTLLEPVRITE